MTWGNPDGPCSGCVALRCWRTETHLCEAFHLIVHPDWRTLIPPSLASPLAESTPAFKPSRSPLATPLPADSTTALGMSRSRYERCHWVHSVDDDDGDSIPGYSRHQGRPSKGSVSAPRQNHAPPPDCSLPLLFCLSYLASYYLSLH